jgi:PIN domain nuclease of toxin-antitoxin system
MIVLDTHTWFWWISSPGQLSPTGKKAIERAMMEGQKNRFSSEQGHHRL